jgi:hypothetical protein
MRKRFVAYFYCNGWDFNLGVHICWSKPNIEIHVPCGFFRIGWSEEPSFDFGARAGNRFLYRSFGFI